MFRKVHLLFVFFSHSGFYFIFCLPQFPDCCVLYIFSLLSHPHPFTPRQQQVLVILKTKKYGCFQRKDIVKEPVPKQGLQDSPLQFLSLLCDFFILFQHISILFAFFVFSSTSLFPLFPISFSSS